MSVTPEEGTAQDLLVLISRGLSLVRTPHGHLAMVLVGSMMSCSSGSTG
jgi:phosphatidylserine decarboxylase